MSSYIQQRNDRDRKMLMAGIYMGMQMYGDFYSVALHRPEVMVKPLGRMKITRIAASVSELSDYYWPAFTNHVEAERFQEELDRALREIVGDDLIPFAERYPWLKQCSYDKHKKGWV